MRRRSRATADDCDPLYHFRIKSRPVIGLLAAHRPAIDQGDPLDAEVLAQQTALHPHIVGHCHARKAAAIVRRTDIARRGRQAVAEHIRDDDEPALRVERAARADQPLGVAVLGAIGGRVDDHIAARGIEPAVGLVGELCVPQCEPGLQRYVTHLENLVIACRHP